MKIEILKDHDHRISPGLVQAFKAGSVVDVPRATAQALIAAGSAAVVHTRKTRKTSAKDHSHG